MRIKLYTLFSLACLFLSACSSIRDVLSSPIMAFERDPISTRYMNHVYESREAARGTEGSAGGGCGCN